MGRLFRDDGVPRILGESPAMEEVRERIQTLAALDSPVLISGETGTGKGLVARAIHALSPRAASPYMAINCATLPEPLFESELFGHIPGAFTGASAERPGLLQSSQGGTLLFDEIGELPLQLQAKLLRVLESKSLRQVGADREIPVDVRILAATNRDLRMEVDSGRFRQDVFYRLNVFNLLLPPLRSRGEDILLLATHFAERFAEQIKKHIRELSQDTADVLRRYAWPGNVRELENCIQHAVALARYETILCEDLPQEILVGGADASDLGCFPPLAEVERQHILALLSKVDQNLTRAARILQIDRKTLREKLKSYAGSGETTGEFRTSAGTKLPTTGTKFPSQGAYLPLAEIERRYIFFILNKVDQNLKKAAEILQINRRTLREKLKRYETSN